MAAVKIIPLKLLTSLKLLSEPRPIIRPIGKIKQPLQEVSQPKALVLFGNGWLPSAAALGLGAPQPSHTRCLSGYSFLHFLQITYLLPKLCPLRALPSGGYPKVTLAERLHSYSVLAAGYLSFLLACRDHMIRPTIATKPKTPATKIPST